MAEKITLHCELEAHFADDFLQQAVAFGAANGEFVEALFVEVERLAKRSGQTVAEYLANDLPKADKIELQRDGKIDYGHHS